MKKDQVEEHAKKIREQFDILEKFLTENKFMAGEHVSYFVHNILISYWINKHLFKIADDHCWYIDCHYSQHRRHDSANNKRSMAKTLYLVVW